MGIHHFKRTTPDCTTLRVNSTSAHSELPRTLGNPRRECNPSQMHDSTSGKRVKGRGPNLTNSGKLCSVRLKTERMELCPALLLVNSLLLGVQGSSSETTIQAHEGRTNVRSSSRDRGLKPQREEAGMEPVVPGAATGTSMSSGYV